MISNLSLVKKRDYYSRILVIFLLCVDLCAFAFATKVITHQSPGIDIHQFYPFVFISALSWIITTCYYQLHTRRKLKSFQAILSKHLAALPLLVVLQLGTFYFVRPPIDLLIPVLALNFYTMALAVVAKCVSLWLYKEMHQQNKARYVIIGYSDMGQRLFEYLQQQKSHSHQFMGFFDDRHIDHCLHAGKVEEIYTYCKKHNIGQIYLASPASASLIEKLASFADSQYIYFGYVVNQTQLQKSLLPSTEPLFDNSQSSKFQTIYV